MPEVLDPPASPVSPMGAIANFIKGNAAVSVDPDLPPAQPTTPPAPPKEPAKPVAAAPIPPEPEKPPTNAQRWKEFTTARDEGFKKRDEEITSLKAQMKSLSEQASKLPADDPEKLSLKRERDELSKQLWTVSRERHPDFQSKYDKQIDQQLAMVQNILGGDAGKKMVKLLKTADPESRDEQVQALLEEAGNFKLARVAPIINQLDQLQAARAQELNVSEQEFKKMIEDHQANEKTRIQKEAQQKRAMIDQMFEAGLLSLRDKEKGIAELAEKDGDEAWNNDLKNRVAEAKKILYGEAEPDKVVRAILRDAAFDTIKKDRDGLRETVAALKAENDALKNASPGLRQHGRQPNLNAPPDTTTKTAMTPKQAFANYQKLVTTPQE